MSTPSSTEVTTFVSSPFVDWLENRHITHLSFGISRFDTATGLLTGTKDGTLVNVYLRLFGPKSEKSLCIHLLVFQVLLKHMFITIFYIMKIIATDFVIFCVVSLTGSSLRLLFYTSALSCWLVQINLQPEESLDPSSLGSSGTSQIQDYFSSLYNLI